MRSGTGIRNASIAVGVVIVALIALLATRGSSTPIASQIVGQAAPNFSGVTLDGRVYELSRHRGEWVVVNFFATWCTECRLEDPQIQAFVTDHAGDPVSVVSLAYSDDPDAIRAYFAKSGATWSVIANDTGRVALDYGVTRVPESYIVAPSGLVVQGFFGGVTAAELDAVIDANGGMAVTDSGMDE
jgi:cytochrome c biogenesis protein CcmG/thiol:disulfide interchange protein DsbE